MSDHLDETIATLYGTVDRQADWGTALDSLCRAVNGHGAMLTLEARDGAVLDHHQCGFDAGWLNDYKRDWAARSPFLRRFYTDTAHAGHFVASDELLSYREWVATEMFNESGRLQDVHHGAAAYFDTADALRVRLSFVRDRAAGAVEPAELSTLDRLVPHIGQALRLGLAFPDPVMARLETLNQRETPALVVGRDLALVDRNEAAHALLELEPRVGLQEGRLRLEDEAAERTLTRAVRACCEDERRQRQVVVRSADGELPLFLLVTRAPFRPGASRWTSAASSGELALISVVLRDRPLRLTARHLRELFALTPAEARLARVIATGQAPDRAAATLGISVSTVRWHLKRIFAKTETASQSELTALLQAIVHSVADGAGDP